MDKTSAPSKSHRGWRSESVLRKNFGEIWSPENPLTDKGSQFTSRIVKRFLQENGIQQRFTAPYSLHENPTERANRTIKTIIAQLADNH